MPANKMFKATGNAPCESDFFDARIKYFLNFTFWCAAVSSALTLALSPPAAGTNLEQSSTPH